MRSNAATTLIKEIKKNLWGTSLSGVDFNQMTDTVNGFSFITLNQITQIIHEMYFYYKTDLWIEGEDFCMLQLHTDSPIPFFIHFTVGEVLDEDFDFNETRPSQHMPNWYFEQTDSEIK